MTCVLQSRVCYVLFKKPNNEYIPRNTLLLLLLVVQERRARELLSFVPHWDRSEEYICLGYFAYKIRSVEYVYVCGGVYYWDSKCGAPRERVHARVVTV